MMLRGARILLTRPAGREAGLAGRLEADGARVENVPVVRFEPTEAPLGDLAGFDGLVFTSATAVSFFVRRLSIEGGAGFPRRVVAVGPATARAVLEAGGPDPERPDPEDASGVERLLRTRGVGARWLWIRPESAARELAETIAGVEERRLYRTVPAPGLAGLVKRLRGGTFDVAAFFSPSGVRALGDGLDETLATVTRVAIGPRTARALADAGASAHAIAGSPADDALARAIRAALACYDARPARVGSGASRLTESEALRRTTLHDVHVAAGARMVAFAGWRMPVQYSGLIEEHRAVRSAAGLFDVSHMGEAAVTGPGAEAFLQLVTCNDVSRLTAGRAHYTALTTESGTFVDDLLIYRRGPEEFLLVLNAANAAKDLAWMRDHAGGFEVEVADDSERWCQLALQGPAAQEILAPLVDRPLGELASFGFFETGAWGDVSIVARTGYTGEDGFEIYAPAAAGPELWEKILASGREAGALPVGLGARDTLRLEARLALYGNDIDETTTVLEADLGFIVKLKKGEFLGRDVLLRQKREGVSRKLAGFAMTGRAVARPGYPVLVGGRAVARVTSGSHAPHLRRNIGLAYLPVSETSPGTEIEVEVRGRPEPAKVVETPFYKRPRPRR